MRRWYLGVLLSLIAAPGALARPYLPPPGHVFAGLTGGTSVSAWQRMVGKHPPVFEDFMTWNTPTGWMGAKDPGFRSRLGVALGTSLGYKQPGVISPQSIALGRSDKFLVGMNRNLFRSGRVTYVRIMGEMNGYWNAYAAFSANGVMRGTQNSPYYYKQAFRRTALILRGGPVRSIDRRLRALGLPPIRGLRHRAVLPRPKVAILWVPQDAGSPEIAANSPAAFWPGARYVDWVGTDFYSSYPNFALLDKFYAEFTGKPFVISEWAVYGFDDPLFVRAMFAWVAAHPRVRLFDYFQAFRSWSPANLSRYPRSKAMLRKELRPRRFLAYPPEYAHPPRHVKRAPPPRPPQPGQPPSPPPSAQPSPPPPSGGGGPLSGLPLPPGSTCVPGIGCLPVP
jgi:hypothetical protein